jgi:ABC-2 type transport system ATP-binding protein
VWDSIRALIAGGVTLLLTTQYLDEADALADQIVVIDHGKVIADGTPAELKRQSHNARLDVTLTEPHAGAGPAIAALVSGPITETDDGRRLSAGVDLTPGLATEVVRALDQAGILVDDIAVREPSLDDVFFALTGHHVEPAKAEPALQELAS